MVSPIFKNIVSWLAIVTSCEKTPQADKRLQGLFDLGGQKIILDIKVLRVKIEDFVFDFCIFLSNQKPSFFPMTY
jgi:hypothetical protein